MQQALENLLAAPIVLKQSPSSLRADEASRPSLKGNLPCELHINSIAHHILGILRVTRHEPLGLEIPQLQLMQQLKLNATDTLADFTGVTSLPKSSLQPTRMRTGLKRQIIYLDQIRISVGFLLDFLLRP